jgi:hypothetical protein
MFTNMNCPARKAFYDPLHLSLCHKMQLVLLLYELKKCFTFAGEIKFLYE